MKIASSVPSNLEIDAPETELSDPLGFQVFNEIGIIAQISGNLLARALPGSMNLSQFLVLNHFVRLGGERTPNELARAFQLSKGAMTNTIGRLESAGLVSVVPDVKDRRAKRVALTPAGRAARDAGVAAVTSLIAEMHQRFDEQELKTLLPLLREMRQWLGTQRQDLGKELADN